MKMALKWIAGILFSLIVFVIAMLVGTRGDYAVARLVTDDPSLPSETVAGVQLHMRITDAELVMVPEAGHDVVWDNPDVTLAVIRSFLNR